jgi:hypothetical protein
MNEQLLLSQEVNLLINRLKKVSNFHEVLAIYTALKILKLENPEQRILLDALIGKASRKLRAKSYVNQDEAIIPLAEAYIRLVYC